MSKKQEANAKAIKGFVDFAIYTGKHTVMLSSQVYQLPPPRPENGKCYFTAPCDCCGKPTPIIEDESGGVPQIRFGGVGAFEFRCFLCRQRTRARPGQITSARFDSTRIDGGA